MQALMQTAKVLTSSLPICLQVCMYLWLYVHLYVPANNFLVSVPVHVPEPVRLLRVQVVQVVSANILNPPPKPTAQPSLGQARSLDGAPLPPSHTHKSLHPYNLFSLLFFFFV